MTVVRTQIRNYIATLLKARVDVNGRVFTNRRSSLFQEELPAVCIENGIENKEVVSGDKYHAKSYENAIQLSIVIGVEETQEAGVDAQQTTNGQDLLDVLGHEVEQALGDDWRLAQLLDGYDANTNYLGLVNGVRLVGGATYDVDSESERKLLAREIGAIAYYTADSFDTPRFPPFNEYHFEFTGFEDSEGSGDVPE